MGQHSCTLPLIQGSCHSHNLAPRDCLHPKCQAYTPKLSGTEAVKSAELSRLISVCAHLWKYIYGGAVFFVCLFIFFCIWKWLNSVLSTCLFSTDCELLELVKNPAREVQLVLFGVNSWGLEEPFFIVFMSFLLKWKCPYWIVLSPVALLS